ncbi:hypothetical protein EHM69_01760 [candidate division KSB1 bacterium]|nr:MAG: hypothetical protein EHM69_01760 [candidate division KSB1 bacterium]
MKILYISPEHVSGTLSLFKAGHERRGDVCRYVTFWHSRWDFPDDICLNLPMMPDKSWVVEIRKLFHSLRPRNTSAERNGVRCWNPGWIERGLFRIRDACLRSRIESAIYTHRLDQFDIIHLDGGLDFSRDARFVRKQAGAGKKIACFYHGSDLRERGVIPPVDDAVGLRLTSEWDLLEMDSRLRYLYLPFDESAYAERSYRFHSPLRIGHASRNRFKGTAFVEAAVRRIARDIPVELVLIRDMPHDQALRLKQECDIFVDQLTNEGGWGYGMSSVEALAMGMPVVTNIPKKMLERIGPHPFVQADTADVADVLISLIRDENHCRVLAAAGQKWVRERHDVNAVMDCLYRYYREVGWLPTN